MEATEALGRSGLSTYLAALQAAVRARSRAFWIVTGVTLVAAGLRFATLGVQAYHHDEIVTASRILRDGFWHAMDAVGFSESAPPLYYVLAWLWTQLTGTGEFGLRSFSALAGVATVPVAYLLGQELRGRRAGITAAILVAVNPMLLWYSQEARGYALLVLLTVAAALYFVRALDRGGRRNFTGWGIASALALATHYFAIFPIALEAVWLLRRRGRDALVGLRFVVLAGLLLAPLAIHQMSQGHAEWIGAHSLGHRLWDAGVTFVTGETGEIIAQPEFVLPAVIPLLAIAMALVLLGARGEGDERRAAGRMLAIAAATIAIPLSLALLVPGKDYVLARNLLPALVPILVAVAVATTLRGARRRGLALATALAAYSAGFCIVTSLSPALQRPDWRAVAGRLGEPAAPRAIVTWTLGEASLRHYLSTGSFQVLPTNGFDWFVHEIDFVSSGPAGLVSPRLLGPRFRQVGYEQVGDFYIRRYALPGPDLTPLRLKAVRGAQLNFRSNGVLVDGVGPS
ncbi:MAG: glycosyltransferase family 39 protein [Solirubrobacterales bacterium]